MLTLQGCSHAGLTKRPLWPRPELNIVEVKNCKMVSGVRWCEVTIEPVLLNDENLKTDRMKIEAEPVWIKEKAR